MTLIQRKKRERIKRDLQGVDCRLLYWKSIDQKEYEILMSGK